MADKKVTQFTELTAVAGTDMVPIIDDPSGSAEAKKITVDNLNVDYPKIETDDQLIQVGYGYLTGDGSNNQTGTVTFGSAFDSAPDTIIISYRGSGASWAPTTTDKWVSYYADTPTATTFRAVAFSTDSGTAVLTNNVKYWYNYIAIGTKAR